MSEDSIADINRLTLQLMVNGNKYKKYLAKQDPALLEEIERRGRDLGKYKSRIISLARDLITYIGTDAESRVTPADSTTELVDIMDRFVNVALAHIKTLDETKIDESGIDLEVDAKSSKQSREATFGREGGVTFGRDEDDDDDEQKPDRQSSTKSAWGPTLHRFGYRRKNK